MYHLESLAAAHTSMTDFFVHTILATHRKLSDAELAGFSRLMEIVISPTQEEVADQLAELAYSEDEWEEFQTQYSKAVSTTNELDIIQRMVELRKVGCLFFFLVIYHVAHRLPQVTVSLKRSSSVAVWAEKVLLSMFCITAERLFRPHSRKRKLLKDTEKAMFDHEFAVKLLEWAASPDGKDQETAAFKAFRLNEKTMRRQTNIQVELYEVVGNTPVFPELLLIGQL